jgi:hypothetical protein
MSRYILFTKLKHLIFIFPNEGSTILASFRKRHRLVSKHTAFVILPTVESNFTQVKFQMEGSKVKFGIGTTSTGVPLRSLAFDLDRIEHGPLWSTIINLDSCI